MKKNLILSSYYRLSLLIYMKKKSMFEQQIEALFSVYLSNDIFLHFLLSRLCHIRLESFKRARGKALI